MKLFNYFVLLALACLMLNTSCVSKKKYLYVQNIDNLNSQQGGLNYEPKLQPDDLLSITVSAEQPELTKQFNLPEIQGNYSLKETQENIKTYLVDKDGYIDFPVLGKLKLAGLSRIEAVNLMQDRIKEYILRPSVNIRIQNFKISVLGEVSKPNTYKIDSERVTLIEALSLAGDMTIYGKRDSVLIIRELNGERSYNRVDMTKADFINSPFYYLSQNDVVLVEPNKTKINSSSVGPNVVITVSIISLLITAGIIYFR